jgi:Zn-dependent metalloprotease
MCIVPPHMLEAIAERGSPQQQEIARACMRSSDQLRERRGEAAQRVFGAAAAAGKERVVYSANNGTGLPGQRVRSEGSSPTGDAAADEAYDGSGDTYDLFQDEYGRNSINGSGLRLDSTVHYSRGFDNAFWDGRQMVYGDGDEDLSPDQRLFNRFTASLDVIGHELTHGVTQYTANLVYQGPSGALNEHFSDVFGSLVKQRRSGQSAPDADWLVGAELLTSNVNGSAIRSMKAPGTAYNDPVLGRDPQPGHMDDYVNTSQDNGGVHINSGIPNHAFYQVATTLGGNAWERAGTIWYRALTDSRLRSNATFQAAAELTATIAADLFGSGGNEHRAVIHGWDTVGIRAGELTDPGEPDEPDEPGEPTPPPPSGGGCSPFRAFFSS